MGVWVAERGGVRVAEAPTASELVRRVRELGLRGTVASYDWRLEWIRWEARGTDVDEK